MNMAPKAKASHGEPGVLWVWITVARDIGNSDNAGLTHAVINKNPVPGLHFADRAQGLRVFYAVPDRLTLYFKLRAVVRFRIRFGEKIPLLSQKPTSLLTEVYSFIGQILVRS